MGTTVTLPLGAIVGIAVGSGLILLLLSVSIAVYAARRRDRRERQRFGNAMSKSWSKRRSKVRSFNPFITQQAVNIEMVDKSPMLEHRNGQMRARLSPQNRLSPQKKLFRVSLSEYRPLRTMSSDADLASTIFPNESARRSCIAPPGYELPPPPKKAHLLKRVPGPFEEISLSEGSPRYRRNGRRATSESHLSSILRSTSQRLKVNDSDLGRSLTTIVKRPTPDRVRSSKSATESCEVLIDQVSTSSRPSSSNRMVARSAILLPPTQRQRSFSLLGDAADSDEDSLVGGQTPEITTLSMLSSPCRHSRKASAQSQRVRVSSVSSVSNQATVYQDLQASSLASREQDVDVSTVIIPHRISLAGDPFLSTVKSSKPKTLVGPRPLLPKTEACEETSVVEQADSNAVPFRDISGNSISPRLLQQQQQQQQQQIPPKPAGTDLKIVFDYSPKDMLQTRSRISSANLTPASAKQKGHKRSNAVRISGLSRPTSVCVVHEEPEGDSPGRLGEARPNAIEQPKTWTKDMPRVPSISVFNPVLTLLRPGFETDTMGATRRETGYSPTLSICKLYHDSEESSNSLSSHNSIPQSQTQGTSNRPTRSATQSHVRNSTHIRARRHCRNFSEELPLRSDPSLFSFPSFPSLTHSLEATRMSVVDPESPASSPQSSRSRVGSLPPSPLKLNTFPLPPRAAEPLPPLITTLGVTTPGHLTGPRPRPMPMRTRTMVSPDFVGLSARDNSAVHQGPSIRKSVGMLRRMNSEATSADTIASLVAMGVGRPDSVRFEEHHQLGRAAGRMHRRSITLEGGASRHDNGSGTKHYLAIGSTPERTLHTPLVKEERGDPSKIEEVDDRKRKRGRRNDNEPQTTSGSEVGLKGLGIQGLGFDFPVLSSVYSVGGMSPELNISPPPPPSPASSAAVSPVATAREKMGQDEQAEEAEDDEKENAPLPRRNSSGRGGRRPIAMYWSKYVPRQASDFNFRPQSHEAQINAQARAERTKDEDETRRIVGVSVANGNPDQMLDQTIQTPRQAEKGHGRGQQQQHDPIRPGSLGLYDADGFLISTSPDRSPSRQTPSSAQRRSMARARSRSCRRGRSVREMKRVSELGEGDADAADAADTTYGNEERDIVIFDRGSNRDSGGSSIAGGGGSISSRGGGGGGGDGDVFLDRWDMLF